MLPGFNHNVRYNNRVYHVQTEDIGLKIASVVTQVFLAGQVLALEKTSYKDVLDAGWGTNDRVRQIRLRMQEQHKTLLKRVTEGAFEAQVDAIVRNGVTVASANQVETTTRMPISGANGDPDAPYDATNLITDERALELEESDFLSSLDAEVRRHIEASDPTLPPFDSSILPAEPPPILPRSHGSGPQINPRTRRMRPPPPPPPDTLVDEPSPLPIAPVSPKEGRNSAAGQKSVRTVRSRRPHSSTLVKPLEQDELRRASAEMGLPMPEEPGHADPNATLLELDAVALKEKLAEQRAKLKRASEISAERWAASRLGHTPPPDTEIRVEGIPAGEQDSSSHLTVNERSLDEVLLSYLDDEE